MAGKSKANEYIRSLAAGSSRSPEMPSNDDGPQQFLMLNCNVEELEWKSDVHSAFLPLFTGV